MFVTSKTYTRWNRRLTCKTFSRPIRRALAWKSYIWRKLRQYPNGQNIKAAYTKTESNYREMQRAFETKKEQQVTNSNDTVHFISTLIKRSSRVTISTFTGWSGEPITADKAKQTYLTITSARCAPGTNSSSPIFLGLYRKNCKDRNRVFLWNRSYARNEKANSSWILRTWWATDNSIYKHVSHLAAPVDANVWIIHVCW